MAGGKAAVPSSLHATCSSWLNQVERWFGPITQQAIRRGSCKSAKELNAKIDRFIQQCNRNSKPFAWTAAADSIFQKLARLCSRISGTQRQRGRPTRADAS